MVAIAAVLSISASARTLFFVQVSGAGGAELVLFRPAMGSQNNSLQQRGFWLVEGLACMWGVSLNS